jgi:hypothetical protein
MSLILPNGYILDTIGQFWGTTNDVSIAKNITNTCESLLEWCEKGDLMIVDRGFCDVIESFIEMGYEPKMPEFLTKGQKQHTVEQANRSCLITKVQWRIESYHARMKKWTLLSGRIENAFIPKVADCVPIVSAALNCYRGSIGENTINSNDTALAQYIRHQIGRNNMLQVRLDNGSLSSRSRWQKIEDSSFDFLQIPLDEIHELFFGTYQIKTGRCYVEEHMNSDGDYIIQVDNSNNNIVRVSIQSRHSNASVYRAWIQFSLTGDLIEACYCQCTSGARNLGYSSHVASIVWYLALARHNNFKPSSGRQRLLQALSINDEENETDADTDSSSEDE